MNWKKFRKNCDSQKLTDTDKTQESTNLSRISELLLKVHIKLFTNSEISHTIDTKDWEMTLRSETRRSIQYIVKKS